VDESTGRRYLKLSDGHVTDRDPNSLAVRVLSFERNDILLPELGGRERGDRLETRRAGELFGASDAESRAELQWRISPALAVLVLSLLAIPLSHSDPREGRGSRVVLGILSYAIYANLLYLCRAWVVDGTLPAWLGLWWVHALVLLSALFWLQRQGRMVGLAG
jgi:lipopolysaccharide export system permease protein